MTWDPFTPPGGNAILASVLVPVLEPASPNAATIRSIFFVVSLISLAIFVIVVTLIVTSLVRFRSTGDSLPKQAFGSHMAEIFWTLPPLLIVLSLGVASAQNHLFDQLRAIAPDIPHLGGGYRRYWPSVVVGSSLSAVGGRHRERNSYTDRQKALRAGRLRGRDSLILDATAWTQDRHDSRAAQFCMARSRPSGNLRRRLL